ncbi:MAG: DUF5716 family protein [Defluviitaleaceae bacterium]|nr:DUF5716 family protein [Defluviitaleaceae bacterium]
MNWKKYKALDPAEKRNEAYYVIGLDMGNDSSAIAFYNLADTAPESIDLSGGYGKPSIPTVMQYVPETKEWVVGEYAILNKGVGTVFSSLTERLGRFDYIDVDGRSLSVASVLAMFIKELLSNVKNINPRAEIVGIVVSVPAYFSKHAQEELHKVFKLAGYEKELIGFIPDRECVLAHKYRIPPEQEEHTLIIDFGSRELRGGLYHVKAEDNGIKATSISSVFDDEISMYALNNDISEMFTSFLEKGAVADTILKEHIPAFTYQHKDILFQKNIRTKPIKLYYNFAYPPIQYTLTYDKVEEMVLPYAQRFNQFIKDVLEKNLYDKKIPISNVNAVLCVGGGFDMLWAKEAVGNIFGKDKVRFFKNSKLINAEGAALIAAHILGLTNIKLTLEDNHQLTGDIGFANGDNFLTLVERNGFWWQKYPAKLILINQSVQGDFDLQLEERREDGKSKNLTTLHLDALPDRPKGVTRLEVRLNFISNSDLIITINDLGFGEIYPKTDYMREFLVKI